MKRSRVILSAFLLAQLISISTHAEGESNSASTNAVVFSQATKTKPTPDPEHPISSVTGETKAQRDLRMAWWRDAKFGMFIHWGVFSVPAGYHHGHAVSGRNVPPFSEWLAFNGKVPMSDYREYAKEFNPTDFDAAKIVAAAKSAGMKYIVITAKHHDGFAMFDSKANRWNIVAATPYGRDPLKALSEECRKQGIKLGFYYSQAQDWNNGGSIGLASSKRPEDHVPWDPSQIHDMDDYMEKTSVPQVIELLSNYGSDTPAILWWDTPNQMTKGRAEKLSAVVKKLHPGIIQNNRLGGGMQGDTKTPEQFIPPHGYPGFDWESCMTLNDSWGYKRDDNHWKSSEELIHKLVDIVSKGGNFLLNVGPDAKGNIPVESLRRLSAVGKWMKVNGEAIYGTTCTPFGEEFGVPVEGKNGNGVKVMVSSRNAWRCTKKNRHLFVIIFKWPKDGTFSIPAFNHQIIGATLLADSSAKLTVTQNEKRIAVSGLPTSAPDPIATVINLKY